MKPDFGNVSLKDLEILLSVCRCGSTSQAAQQYQMSPQGLRKVLQKIERHFETPVYYRARGDFRLTEQGILIRDAAEQILSQMTELEKELREEKNRTKRFHIVFGDGLLRFLTPQWLEILQKNCDDIQILYGEQREVELMRQMCEESGPDLCLCVSSEKTSASLQQAVLIESRLYGIVDRGHPLAEKKELSLKDILSCPLIPPPAGSHTRLLWEAFCKKADEKPEIRYESSQYAPELAAGDLLLLTDGFHLIDGTEIHSQWKAIPLNYGAPSVRLSLFHRKKHTHIYEEQIRTLLIQYLRTMRQPPGVAYRFLGGMAKIPGGYNTSYRVR